MSGKRDKPGPGYLEPYRLAVEHGGPGFESLLWNSKAGQEARFRVVRDTVDLTGRVVADLGCGRADFAAHLHHTGVEYGRYVGVEALPDLLAFCRDRAAKEPLPECIWLEGDFVSDHGLFKALVRTHGVDTLVFSGSLNTLEQPSALDVLGRAWDAISPVRDGALVYNFLSSMTRRGPHEDTGPAKRYDTPAMIGWALDRADSVALRQDYLGAHDATIVMRTG